MGLDESSLFETEIFAKRGAAAALERELPPGRDLEGGIAIGTATDPYQPAERKYLITRSLLEVFARREGLRLSITTKSDLVTRDLDLLVAIARSNDLTVNFSITTLHRRLARLLEPRAPRPLLRFRAMEALANAGIATGLFIMPIIPGLTDSPIALETLVAHAAAAGARRVGHQVLFLRLSAKKVFLPFLRETFPKLAPHYRRVYSASPTHTPEYRRRIDEAMKALKERHGFEQKRSQEREGRPRPQPRGQLALAF
jgi:DNA repair photolyase